MLKVCYSLIFIFFVHSLHAQDYDNKHFVGYWAEYTFIVPDSCSLDSIPDLEMLNLTLDELLSDSLLIEFIKNEGDSTVWEYGFKADGTFIGNSSWFCNNQSYQSAGNWDYKNGEFALQQVTPCWEGSSEFDHHYYPVQWISPSAFYECGEEGKGTFVITIFKKIPTGLIQPN